jgi:hypothetical protein
VIKETGAHLVDMGQVVGLRKITSKPIKSDHEANLMECARPKCPIQTQNDEKRITQEKDEIVLIQEKKLIEIQWERPQKIYGKVAR